MGKGRKDYAKAKELRLNLVAKYYARSYNAVQIQAKVKQELNLPTYNIKTTLSDIETVKEEWKQARIEEVEEMKRSMFKEAQAVKQECWDYHEREKAKGESGSIVALSEVRHENEFVANSLYELKKNSVELQFGGDWHIVLCNPETAKRTEYLMKNHKIEDLGGSSNVRRQSI